MANSKALVPQAHGGAIHQGRPPGYLNPKAGRPTGLTPQVRNTILKAVENGCYAHVAAAKAGITEKTLYEWINRGESGEEPFREFSECLLTSCANAEDRVLGILKSAQEGSIDGDWKAGAW